MNQSNESDGSMFTIDLISNHRHHIPTLAGIWDEVLGSVWVPSITTEQVQKWMVSWQEEQSLPIGYIALDDNVPIGVCALQRNDGIRFDLWPWLTDLCVAPSSQKQGVGKHLIKTTQKKALELGYKHLYLFTFDPQLIAFYHRFGFTELAKDNYRNLPVTVMVCALKK